MSLNELLPAVRELTAPEKLRLIRILAEDLDTSEDISPFEHHTTYCLATPYNSYGAAGDLADTLADLKENGG